MLHKLVFLYVFCSCSLFATSIQDVLGKPKETSILHLNDQESKNWKVVDQMITEKNSVVIYIPINEDPKKCTGQILITYCADDEIKNSSLPALQKQCETRLNKTLQGRKSTCKILETNQTDFIFEQTVTEPKKPDFSLIGRVVYKNGAAHSIERLHFGVLTPKLREEYSKLLKEQISIEKMDKISAEMPGLSLAHKTPPQFDLGSGFHGWRYESTRSMLMEGWSVLWLPQITRELRRETLTINQYRKSCIPQTASLDDLLKFEMDLYEQLVKKKLDFHIRKKTSNDVVYNFYGPIPIPSLKTTVTTTNLIRIVNVDGELYTCIYRNSSNLTDEELADCQTKLEGIKVINRGNDL